MDVHCFILVPTIIFVSAGTGSKKVRQPLRFRGIATAGGMVPELARAFQGIRRIMQPW